jgi:hypothetical protein
MTGPCSLLMTGQGGGVEMKNNVGSVGEKMIEK